MSREETVGEPMWLRAFSAVEGAVGPHVEAFVHGSKFSSAVVVVAKVKSGVSGIVERRTRDVWHLVNLPAGSDVAKLRHQIGDLDHEVRLLRGTVESDARKQARLARLAQQAESATDPASGSDAVAGESGMGERGEDHGSDNSGPAGSK